MGSTAFFVDFSPEAAAATAAGAVPSAAAAPVLGVRKPGTPTKRAGNGSSTHNAGEENKTVMGNRLDVGDASRGPLAVKGVSGVNAQLPERLQKRLASLPGRPSAEKILQKEEQVEMKREEMIRAKVEGAAQEGAKVEQVRARKKDFDKNMCLMVGCRPSELRAVQPTKLPGRLQKRLRELELATASRRGAEAVYAREEAVAARREARLAKVVAQHRSHAAKVAAMREAKASVERFGAEAVPAFLPPRLAGRVKELRRPTNDALLRKEALAATRRQLLLAARAQKAKEHMVKVQAARAARDAFRANQVDFGTSAEGPEAVKLPTRLAQRAAAEAPKWSTDGVLAKADRAAAQRADTLAAKQAKARAHLARVKQLREAKTTQPRFDNGAAAGAEFLPDGLKQRLAQLRRPTPDAILRQEKLTARRAQLKAAARAQVARAHNTVDVARVRALKQSMSESDMVLATTADTSSLCAPLPLPARLKTRLAKLRQAKFAQWSPEALLAKEAAAAERRANRLEGVVAASTEHSAKVDKLCTSKRLEPRFGNNAAASANAEGAPATQLPEALRARLESIRRPTPEAILRKNAVAQTRAKAATAQRAAVARACNNAADAAHRLAADMRANGIDLVSGPPAGPTPLPPRLAARAAKLGPKWTPEKLIAKEAAATARRRASLRTAASKAKQHNAVAKARMGAKTREARFDDAAGAETLPDALKARMQQLTKPTGEAILRKEKMATARRAQLLAARAQRAAMHTAGIDAARELKAAMEETGVELVSGPPAAKAVLPERLAKRIESLAPKWTAESVAAKQTKAAQARRGLIKGKQAKAKEHNKRAQARKLAKETQPRFDADTVPDFLPAALKSRLAELRRPTADALLRQEKLAARRAQLAADARASRAALHQEHVRDVCRTGAAFKDNMDLMTTGAVTPVKLPKRMQARVAALEAVRPSPEQLLAKEAAAASRRSAQLRERSAKLAEHGAKVKAVWAAKKTAPRYAEAPNTEQLPTHLKEKLKTYRSPIKDVLRAKEARAEQRRQAKLEAKAGEAAKHLDYVKQVKALKQQFVENKVSFIPDERDESPSVPPKIRAKLTEARSPKSAEELAQKESAVANQREALLSERVHAAQKHAAKVNEVRARRKSASQGPETDE